MEAPPPVIEQPPVVKKRKNEGRPVTDKQREALRKGMEAIKMKREALAKEKEERKAKGLPDPPKVVKPTPAEPVAVPTRKPRKEYVRPPVNERKSICRDDFNALKTMVEEIAKKPVAEKVVEKEVVKPVEKIVEREVVKVLSGSDLLNAVFFGKK